MPSANGIRNLAKIILGATNDDLMRAMNLEDSFAFQESFKQFLGDDLVKAASCRLEKLDEQLDVHNQCFNTH